MRNKIGLFLLRITLGITFFLHGLAKFQEGIGATVESFSSMGLPGFLAYIVATIELVGGLAMIVGAGTKIISALFALIMIGAIFTAKLPGAFLGGFELDLILLAVSLHLLFNGSHVLALESLLADSKRGEVSYIAGTK